MYNSKSNPSQNSKQRCVSDTQSRRESIVDTPQMLFQYIRKSPSHYKNERIENYENRYLEYKTADKNNSWPNLYAKISDFQKYGGSMQEQELGNKDVINNHENTATLNSKKYNENSNDFNNSSYSTSKSTQQHKDVEPNEKKIQVVKKGSSSNANTLPVNRDEIFDIKGISINTNIWYIKDNKMGNQITAEANNMRDAYDDNYSSAIDPLKDAKLGVEMLKHQVAVLEHKINTFKEDFRNIKLNNEANFSKQYLKYLETASSKILKSCKDVGDSVNALRNTVQAEAFATIEKKIRTDTCNLSSNFDESKERLSRYHNACNSETFIGSIDQRFETLLLKCTVVDQKQIRKKLAYLMDKIQEIEVVNKNEKKILARQSLDEPQKKKKSTFCHCRRCLARQA